MSRRDRSGAHSAIEIRPALGYAQAGSHPCLEPALTTPRRTIIALIWGATASICIAACASGEAPSIVSGFTNEDAAAGAGGSGSQTPSTGGQQPSEQPSEGSCNPAFCPSSGAGTPCCVAPNGPCGHDFGNGCVSQVPQDAG
jgi:hypothetical protein